MGNPYDKILKSIDLDGGLEEDEHHHEHEHLVNANKKDLENIEMFSGRTSAK